MNHFAIMIVVMSLVTVMMSSGMGAETIIDMSGIVDNGLSSITLTTPYSSLSSLVVSIFGVGSADAKTTSSHRSSSSRSSSRSLSKTSSGKSTSFGSFYGSKGDSTGKSTSFEDFYSGKSTTSPSIKPGVTPSIQKSGKVLTAANGKSLPVYVDATRIHMVQRKDLDCALRNL